MVMAPIKKIRISHVFPKWCNSVSSKNASWIGRDGPSREVNQKIHLLIGVVKNQTSG